jgi:hypothetical protein
LRWREASAALFVRLPIYSLGMGNVSGYTTRTGKRVRTYSRGGGVRRRVRTGVSLDRAIRNIARDNWGGGRAFGSSPGSYRNHLGFTTTIYTRTHPKVIRRSELGSLARKARYQGNTNAKARFLALNAERRRRGGKRRK